MHWSEVDSYKHLEADVKLSSSSEAIIPKASTLARKYNVSDKELETIMLRTFGPIRRKQYGEPKILSSSKKEKPRRPRVLSSQRNMVIIDGYNLIYADERLTKTELILVFDAYLVKDGGGSEYTHDGYRVVYTKENQTADAYIEKMMHELGPDYSIRMVTSDRLLQFSAVQSGISRITAKEFWEELTRIGNEITEFVRKLAESKS